MTFGERVKMRRESLGYTLAYVAEKVGVSEATMQRYESGVIKNPTQPRIAALARALSVDVNYLMAWDEDDPISDDEDDLWELREELRRRPEMRVLFSATKKATKEDLLTAIKIIDALRGESEHDDM